MTLSFVYHVDLPETWNDLKKALGQLAPKNTVFSHLLGKVLLHNISSGIQNAGALPDEKKAAELRTFLTTTADLNLGENAEEIMRDAKRGVLFREEAALSETDCGTFWTELLSTRPVEDYYNHVDPDGLFELFSELSSAYAYFGGKKDEEMGEAQDYQNALEEAYNTHWQNKVLLHPDVERAKRLLAQGKFPDYEDICREILLVEYPEEVPHETAEDFDELSWNDILDDVFASNTAKGIQMWRRLLDIAEPSLKTDAETAEKLLPDWDWLDSPSHKAEVIDVLRERYVLTAYAKGLTKRQVLVRHVLRNALILVTIMFFLNIPWVISGAVIIENIFVIPGMGKTLTEAILNQDFPVVQASVLLLSILTVVCNIICDIITAILDPRILISMGGSSK